MWAWSSVPLSGGLANWCCRLCMSRMMAGLGSSADGAAGIAGAWATAIVIVAGIGLLAAAAGAGTYLTGVRVLVLVGGTAAAVCGACMEVWRRAGGVVGVGRLLAGARRGMPAGAAWAACPRP